MIYAGGYIETMGVTLQLLSVIMAWSDTCANFMVEATLKNKTQSAW
jgi:hypothetical protein